MAFPTVTSITTTAFETGNPTSHDVAMPATVLADELLAVTICTFATSGGFAVPTGWTELSDDDDGADVSLGVWVKKAVGDEDGTTVDFVSSTGRKGQGICYRITAWSGTLSEVEVGTAATGVGAASNPPSLTLGTGADDNLWIAITAMNGVQTIASVPSGYGTATTLTALSGNSASLSTAENTTTSATEDPGSYTWNAADEWITQTLGVPPAAAAAVYPPFPRRQNTLVRM